MIGGIMRTILSTFTALLFTSTAYAQVDFDNPKGHHTMCAAANALVAVKFDEGIMKDLLRSVAQREAALARSLGATDTDIQQALKGFQLANNSGALPWEELVTFAQACSAE